MQEEADSNYDLVLHYPRGKVAFVEASPGNWIWVEVFVDLMEKRTSEDSWDSFLEAAKAYDKVYQAEYAGKLLITENLAWRF